MQSNFYKKLSLIIFTLLIIILNSKTIHAVDECSETGFEQCIDAYTNQPQKFTSCKEIKQGQYISQWETFCDTICGVDCPKQVGTRNAGCHSSLPNSVTITGYCNSGTCRHCNEGYSWNGNVCQETCKPYDGLNNRNLGCQLDEITNSITDSFRYCSQGLLCKQCKIGLIAIQQGDTYGCVPSTCSINNTKDDGESGVDCGNLKCPACINCYTDSDSDTFGNKFSQASLRAECLSNQANNNLDCNDNLASINPNKPEICNNVDDNCNGQIDEDPASNSCVAQVPYCNYNTKISYITPTCIEGACSFGFNSQDCTNNAYCALGNCFNCDSGYKNCNQNPSDRCEVNILNDNNNCGACGNTCRSGKYCQNGQCVNNLGCGDPCFLGMGCNSQLSCIPWLAGSCVNPECKLSPNCACCTNSNDCTYLNTQCTVGSCVYGAREFKGSCVSTNLNSGTLCNPVGPSCNGNLLTQKLYGCDGLGTCQDEILEDELLQDCATDAYCAFSACETCEFGHKNCNRNPTDECEINILEDVNNCGACGNICRMGNICQAGVCTLPSQLQYYLDLDKDSYGNPATNTTFCEDCVTNGLDCNDANALINPAMPELCNRVDDNCNGIIDEGCGICGNKILERGEECDDGNLINGDGCSSECVKTNCIIESLTLSPSNIMNSCSFDFFGKNCQAKVTVNFKGDDCPLLNNVKMNLTTIDESCGIRPNGVNILGIIGNLTTENSTFTYTLPSVPLTCSDKTVIKLSAHAYTDNKIRTNNLFQQNIFPPITLESCSSYGTLGLYYLNKDPTNSPLFTSISTNGCISHSCVSKEANAVEFLNEKELLGVRIILAKGDAPVEYLCGEKDGVCPDDFGSEETSFTCGDTSGICSINGVLDTDCDKQTYMACGKIETDGDKDVYSCNVPTPRPSLACDLDNSCVYANETTGINPPPQCYNFNSTRLNAKGYNITCSNANHWCVKGYTYDINKRLCVKDLISGGSIGSSNCQKCADLGAFDNIYNKGTTNYNIDEKELKSAVIAFLKNPDCFNTTKLTGTIPKENIGRGGADLTFNYRINRYCIAQDGPVGIEYLMIGKIISIRSNSRYTNPLEGTGGNDSGIGKDNPLENCGDGILDPNEMCDFNNEETKVMDCIDLSREYFVGGRAFCSESCEYDISNCELNNAVYIQR